MKQRLQIGAACERDWLNQYYDGSPRPYRSRESIIDWHVRKIEWQYGIQITPRTVASWWALFRKSRDGQRF
jgi:hypothetical protein